jgi:hypothetical protein
MVSSAECEQCRRLTTHDLNLLVISNDTPPPTRQQFIYNQGYMTGERSDVECNT